MGPNLGAGRPRGEKTEGWVLAETQDYYTLQENKPWPIKDMTEKKNKRVDTGEMVKKRGGVQDNPGAGHYTGIRAVVKQGVQGGRSKDHQELPMT